PPGIQLLKAVYSPDAGMKYRPTKLEGRLWKAYSTCALGHAGTCKTPCSTRPAPLTSNEVQKSAGSISLAGSEPGLGTGFIMRFRKSCRFLMLSLSATCFCIALKPGKLETAPFA